MMTENIIISIEAQKINIVKCGFILWASYMFIILFPVSFYFPEIRNFTDTLNIIIEERPDLIINSSIQYIMFEIYQRNNTKMQQIIFQNKKMKIMNCNELIDLIKQNSYISYQLIKMIPLEVKENSFYFIDNKIIQYYKSKKYKKDKLLKDLQYKKFLNLLNIVYYKLNV